MGSAMAPCESRASPVRLRWVTIMTLDLNLVRQILLTAQDAPANREIGAIEIEPWSRDVVLEHIEALDEAGLLEARLLQNHRGKSRLSAAHVVRLTWHGHDFLGMAANENVWTRTMTLVNEKGGSVSLGVLKELLGRAEVRQFSSDG
jgi:hypothetical protein